MASDLPSGGPFIRMQWDLKPALQKNPRTSKGAWSSTSPVYRLPCLHHWLRSGKLTASGRGLSGGVSCAR
jgi:hypothetical protein